MVSMQKVREPGPFLYSDGSRLVSLVLLVQLD
jgi:hypothetical protein